MVAPDVSGNKTVGGPHTRSPERRQLTVMFCDLVGSTRLSLELEAEDFTDLVNAYRDECVRIVRLWRGYVARYVGDGVLVYFGYPSASEDDALRGVAAAWELAQAVSSIKLPPRTGGDEARAATPSHLQARISLHTGLSIVGDMVGTSSVESDGALGAVPNIAARLQSLASPGRVVISEATAELLPPSIALEPLGLENRVADLADIRVFTVSAMPQQPARRPPESTHPLVGRSVLLGSLRTDLEDAASDRIGGLLLCGEPGIGKSRLVRELLESPPGAAMEWIQLVCSAYGTLSPLHPFGELLGASGATTSPSSKDTATGTTPAALKSPYEQRRRAFDGLKATLLNRRSRLGLVIEDIHWADSTSLEFVDELLQSVSAERLFVVMTARRMPEERFLRTHRLRVETLGRLSPGDAAALARGLSSSQRLPASEVADIVARADGVPLFIEEFVRAASHARSDRIPITLRDSLMSVLDGLGTGRTVALCASVFGRRFEYVHLRELLELDDSELAPAVQALTLAQILVQTGDIPRATLEFRHALLRDIAYDTLLKSERRRWHLRVAEMAASGKSGIADSMPELLALHHSLGGSHKRAIEFWLRAHGRALGRSANVEALAHVRSGLEDCRRLAKLEPDDAATLELALLQKVAVPLIAISGWSTPELENIYARATALCQVTGSAEAEFEVDRGLYNLHLLRSELQAADAVADRLLTRAGEPHLAARGTAPRLVALRSKALSAFYTSSFREARALLEQTLQLYDPDRHAGHALEYGIEPRMLAHSYLAWMDASEGRRAPAEEHVREALACAHAENHAFSVCYATCFAASCAQLCGDARSASVRAEEALSIGDQHNFPYWVAWAKALQGWALGIHSAQAGIERLEEALADYRATGSTLVAPYFEALLCTIERAAGIDTWLERHARMRSQAEACGVSFWEVVMRSHR